MKVSLLSWIFIYVSLALFYSAPPPAQSSPYTLYTLLVLYIYTKSFDAYSMVLVVFTTKLFMLSAKFNMKR